MKMLRKQQQKVHETKKCIIGPAVKEFLTTKINKTGRGKEKTHTIHVYVNVKGKMQVGYGNTREHVCAFALKLVCK